MRANIDNMKIEIETTSNENGTGIFSEVKSVKHVIPVEKYTIYNNMYELMSKTLFLHPNDCPQGIPQSYRTFFNSRVLTGEYISE